jgi:hypothetical protein
MRKVNKAASGAVQSEPSSRTTEPLERAAVRNITGQDVDHFATTGV